MKCLKLFFIITFIGIKRILQITYFTIKISSKFTFFFISLEQCLVEKNQVILMTMDTVIKKLIITVVAHFVNILVKASICNEKFSFYNNKHFYLTKKFNHFDWLHS